MHLDSLLEFCDATSVAAGTGTANVGNQIPLSAVGDARNTLVDVGEQLYLVITIDTSIITGGSAGTIQFQLASDSTASLATNGTQSIHWQSYAYVTDDDIPNDLDGGVVVAGCTHGTIIAVLLPRWGELVKTAGGAADTSISGASSTATNRQPGYEAYLGIQTVIGTTTITAGKINAFLTWDPKRFRAYNNAI